MQFFYDPNRAESSRSVTPWSIAQKACKITSIVIAVYVTYILVAACCADAPPDELHIRAVFNYAMTMYIVIGYLLALTFYLLYAFFSWLMKREKDALTANDLLVTIATGLKAQPINEIDDFSDEPIKPVDAAEIERIRGMRRTRPS